MKMTIYVKIYSNKKRNSVFGRRPIASKLTNSGFSISVITGVISCLLGFICLNKMMSYQGMKEVQKCLVFPDPNKQR